jgi:peroxiredoxin
MQSIMKKVIFYAPLIIYSLLILVACGPDAKVVKIGDAAPDFNLVDRQGKTWTLSELRGQVVFVNFWATWCPPCREEMPSMQRLYDMMPKDKFKMLAILNNDDPALADSFATKLGLNMPILNDQANIVGPTYGLTGMPETFIINKKGRIVRKFIGAEQWDENRFIEMLQIFLDQ